MTHKAQADRLSFDSPRENEQGPAKREGKMQSSELNPPNREGTQVVAWVLARGKELTDSTRIIHRQTATAKAAAHFLTALSSQS